MVWRDILTHYFFIGVRDNETNGLVVVYHDTKHVGETEGWIDVSS